MCTHALVPPTPDTQGGVHRGSTRLSPHPTLLQKGCTCIWKPPSPLGKVPAPARILGLKGLQALQNGGVTGGGVALLGHTTTADAQTPLVGTQDTTVPLPPYTSGVSPSQAPPPFPVTAAAATIS